MRKAKVYFLNGLTVSFVGLVLRFAAMAYPGFAPTLWRWEITEKPEEV